MEAEEGWLTLSRADLGLRSFERYLLTTYYVPAIAWLLGM